MEPTKHVVQISVFIENRPGRAATVCELLAVPRDALVDVGDLVLEAVELQRADLIAGGALDLGHEDGHWGTFRD